jgi:hypothetical protein
MRTRKKNPKGRDEKAPLESGTEWKGKEDGSFTGRERNRGLQKRPNAKKRWRYALAALSPGDGSTAGGSGGNGVEVTVG